MATPVAEVGYGSRVAGADASINALTFDLVYAPGVCRGGSRHLLLDAACSSVLESVDHRKIREYVESWSTRGENMSAHKLPQPRYPLEESPIPTLFTDEKKLYAQMTPQERSTTMKGNVKLAMEMVRWSSARRMHAFPSLVNSDQLGKLLFSELEELRELNGVSEHHDDFSLLRRVLEQGTEKDKRPWYAKENAMEAWDVTGELADIAFCSLQHWIVYDSFSLTKAVNQAKLVMKKFDKVSTLFSTERLIDLVESYSRESGTKDGIPQFDPGIEHVWPEFYLGLVYLLSKRVGIDIWEAITLKSFANERHYPTALRLDEKVEGIDGDRLMDDPRRPPAWLFAKRLRKMASPSKRFIGPMMDPFARETVLDLVFESPYSTGEGEINLVRLAHEAHEAQESFIIPAALAEADAAQWYSSTNYYVRSS